MADDIKLLKDAINVGEKTLLKFINKNINKKEKALHQLHKEEDKLHSRTKTKSNHEKEQHNDANISTQNEDDEIDDGSEENDEDDDEIDEEEEDEIPQKHDQPTIDKIKNTTGSKDIENNKNHDATSTNNNTSKPLINTVNNTKFNELVDLIVQSLNNNNDVKENVQNLSNETTAKKNITLTENVKDTAVENLTIKIDNNNNQNSSLLYHNRYQFTTETAKSKDSSLHSVDDEKVQGSKKVKNKLFFFSVFLPNTD